MTFGWPQVIEHPCLYNRGVYKYMLEPSIVPKAILRFSQPFVFCASAAYLRVRAVVGLILTEMVETRRQLEIPLEKNYDSPRLGV